MASELKFRSWEELFDFLLKVPVDIRLRYLSLLLKRKLNKNIHDKLLEMQSKSQQELDSLKLWKRAPTQQRSQPREIIGEKKEVAKKTALENTVADNSLGLKNQRGIVDYTKANDIVKSATQMYGAKKFEENKEGITYSQKSNVEYMPKAETEYTTRVSQSGIGSFKTSEEIIKESEKYKIKYKSK